MKYVKVESDYFVVRLEKGELLVESLKKFAVEQKLEGAWLSGLGAALWAEIGFYELDSQRYVFKKLNKILEICSLQGNIAWTGQDPVIHLHGTFSDDTLQAFGGHVKELEAAGTCEVLVQLTEPLARKLDQATGLQLLDL